MPEGREAGIAEQEIQAHGEERQDQHARREAQVIAAEAERQREKDDEDRDPGKNPGAAAHSRPNNPVGRMARIAAIGTKMVNIASSGKNALPKLSSSPTSKPPTSAPFRLPRPPTITTTNASSSTSKSAPGYTPSSGPPRTPPSAARKAPSAKTNVKSSETLMPRPRAVSSSSTPARSIAPTR